MQFVKKRWMALALLAAAGTVARGAPAAKPTASIATVTPEAYRAHLETLRGVASACQTNAGACDGTKVGNDDRVETQHFDVRWQWLRRELERCKTATPDERQAAMRDTVARLNEMYAESTGGTDTTAAVFTKARPEATRILDSAEFSDVRGFSWWDRIKARMQYWLTRMFSGVSSWAGIGQTLLTMLVWLFFIGAAVGLVFMVRRALARQRLAIAAHGMAQGSAWDRESNDWADQAQASAAKGDFRDAVHCLYWAAIVMLERKKAWRHNPTRTPREYVRLLKPGSVQQGALRKLTQMFERLWYGLRDAKQTDYEQALALYEGLQNKSTEAPVGATTEAA